MFNKINNKVREIKPLITKLAINDFKVRYVGSYLGIIWAFIQPLVTILIYWFVFQVGFRSGSRPDGVPYIIWLVCGIVPWFFFAEAIGAATNTLWEYSYLVKKVVFDVQILPTIKIISALFIHIFFVGFTIVMLSLYGIPFSIVNLQVIYYMGAMTFLIAGLSMITSSIMVFFKDMGQIVSIFIQIGFWMIPIVWSPETIPVQYMKLFKLNPMYYIVEGYRDTFINHVWFWNRYNQTIYFWVVSIIIFVVGCRLFKKLKPHFADVL